MSRIVFLNPKLTPCQFQQFSGLIGSESGILSYLRQFSSYNAQNWYKYHIWSVEAKYLIFTNIIGHCDKMTSYGSDRMRYGKLQFNTYTFIITRFFFYL